MSAGIIHEINNPLNFAQTGLHMLANLGNQLPQAERGNYDEIIKDIREGITRVSGIVSDLRGFTHPSGGTLEEVNARTAVESALRFLAAEWKNSVTVTNEVPEDFILPAIRTRLVQVLVNLMQNSLDAIKSKPPPDGQPTIRIRSEQRERSRALIIWDNGPGIPAHHRARVFDPFFTTKEVGKGTGLGLSICYRLLNDMGARISVESEEGRFCEFTLEFPETNREANALEMTTAA
jgi:C4-dicarboxylate-specific signal transduction histidine kinase